MVKEDIETVIDRLYDYVMVNKKVSVKNAADALNLPIDQVEKLSFLLEESGLIEVRYTLGGSSLVAKPASQQPREMSLEDVEEEKQVKPIDKAALLEQEIEGAEHVASFMEKDLLRRLKRAEGALKALESQDDISKQKAMKLRGEITSLLTRVQVFDSSVKKVEVEGEVFSEKLAEFKSRLDKLEKTKASKAFTRNFMELLLFYIAFLRSLLLGTPSKAGEDDGLGGDEEKPPLPAGTKKEPAKEKKKFAVPGLNFDLPSLFQAEKKVGEIVKEKVKAAVPKKQGKRPDGWRRILINRIDKVRQHYWRRKRK